MVWVSLESGTPGDMKAPVAETVKEEAPPQVLVKGGNFIAVNGLMAQGSLESRLGNVDGLSDINAGVDMSTGINIYRFRTEMSWLVNLSSRLNLARSQMLSANDHGIVRAASDPSWWHPEQDMKCCTRFIGTDAKKSGSLFIGYNDNTRIAYVVFIPRDKARFPLQRR